jgi:hypothetical protein
MRAHHRKSFLLPLAAGLVQILSGCLASTASDPDKSAGGSDEIDTRLAVDPSGRPVAGARIALVRTDDSTGKPVALSATGPDGSFPSFVVPDGFYSVVLRDSSDSLGKFVDSVAVKNQKLPAGRDTLRILGEVRGIVRVAAGHSPAIVTVGLLGTDILANVKADGTFKIELVPGGLYTLGAFPTLDGYGPLYKRIQLKDGQNLALPDTLVMPFTGLPSPGALRVLQDTGSGNVRVSWSRVDHPDLLGYVLERVEGGAVTTSRYLTDTAWTDSLGASWEAMPLLGPWPARDVAYRVRSRSLSGAPDSKSAAEAFSAKAPEWTKRVDSVKVTMSTDSVTGVTTLKWNALFHPDVVGWRVKRSVSNMPLCLEDVSEGTWNDSGCGDPRLAVVSRSTDSGKTVRLVRPQSPVVEYAVQAVRRSGTTQESATASWKAHSNLELVQWRDSTAIPATVAFRSFGGWLLWTEEGKNSKVSRDGSNWEEIPDQANGTRWLVDGQGDSLWMARYMGNSVVEVASRMGAGSWVKTTYRTVDGFKYLNEVVVVGGRLGLRGESVQLYRTSPADSLVEVPGVINPIYAMLSGVTATLPDSGWMRTIGGLYGFDGATVYQGDPVRSVRRVVLWGSLGTRFRSPIGNEGGYLFDYGQSPAYFAPTGDAWHLPTPQGKDVWDPQSATVFRDEIWAIIDGHLWKGKLNLPK